jgi:hypothetical protein
MVARPNVVTRFFFSFELLFLNCDGICRIAPVHFGIDSNLVKSLEVSYRQKGEMSHHNWGFLVMNI